MTTTERKPLTPEERAARLEALRQRRQPRSQTESKSTLVDAAPSPERKTRKRKAHPARNSRAAATGLAGGLTVGLIAGLAATGAASSPVAQVVEAPVAATTNQPAATPPPTTQAPQTTAAQPSTTAPSTTQGPVALTARRQVQTRVVQVQPATRPAAVSRTNGSR
jgi:hypothetical protein